MLDLTRTPRTRSSKRSVRDVKRVSVKVTAHARDENLMNKLPSQNARMRHTICQEHQLELIPEHCTASDVACLQLSFTT